MNIDMRQHKASIETFVEIESAWVAHKSKQLAALRAGTFPGEHRETVAAMIISLDDEVRLMTRNVLQNKARLLELEAQATKHVAPPAMTRYEAHAINPRLCDTACNWCQNNGRPYK